jgi:hypothetical protein
MDGLNFMSIEVNTPLSYWENLASAHSPMISYLYCEISWFSIVPPGKCQGSTSDYPITVYFHILSNSLFTVRPNIQCDIPWVTDVFVK